MHPMETRAARLVRDDTTNVKDTAPTPQTVLEFTGIIEKRLTVLADVLGLVNDGLGPINGNKLCEGGVPAAARSAGVLPDLAECCNRLDTCITTAQEISRKIGNNG